MAFQPVFKEGWTAFRQLAFKAGRLFSSWPFGHFANKMTTPMPQSVGPKFVRNAFISLDKLCTNPQFSGWRDYEQARVDELHEAFAADIKG